jgi:thymidylate synthase ThyX
MQISANILADSFNKYSGDRITTFILRYPRFIHTHLLTHRDFSRNTSSSRAIPISRYIDVVMNNCAMPLEFRTNQKGMQSGGALSESDNDLATQLWLKARDNAVENAKDMIKLNVSKESVNRILEPFMWIETILTATEFQNFYDQRISELAQPEICELATKMQLCQIDSTPNQLGYDNCWHLPYQLLDLDKSNIPSNLISFGIHGNLYPQLVCAGQCARVSYTKFIDSDRHSDIDNYRLAVEKLVPSRHWSPLEHVAKLEHNKLTPKYDNFKGFRSLRNIITPFISKK